MSTSRRTSALLQSLSNSLRVLIWYFYTFSAAGPLLTHTWPLNSPNTDKKRHYPSGKGSPIIGSILVILARLIRTIDSTFQHTRKRVVLPAFINVLGWNCVTVVVTNMSSSFHCSSLLLLPLCNVLRGNFGGENVFDTSLSRTYTLLKVHC